MDCLGMGMGDLCPGTLCCPATHEGNWFRPMVLLLVRLVGAMGSGTRNWEEIGPLTGA